MSTRLGDQGWTETGHCNDVPVTELDLGFTYGPVLSALLLLVSLP
jgi:hypothetical protein